MKEFNQTATINVPADDVFAWVSTPTTCRSTCHR